MQEKLTYSEILYLFADKYVPEGRFLQNKEELPNGVKLDIVKLGNLLAEVAFAYLYFNKHIELKIVSKKMLGLIPKNNVVSTKTSDGAGLTSLEKLIFNLSEGTNVSTILYRLIGQECPVPWSVVTSVAKESLVSKGYLTKEEIVKKILISFTTYKYHLNPSKSLDMEAEVSDMNAKLKEFSQKDFYKMLVKSINSGIESQREKPDNDD